MRQLIPVGPAGYQTEIFIHGDPKNVPVLFFHGLAASANCIGEALDILCNKGLYMIAINRPGTGNSDFFKPADVFEYTRNLRQALYVCGVSNAHVMGWSAGGLFAQAFCIENLEYCLSLSLLSSAIPFFNAGSRKELPVAWRLSTALLRPVPAVTHKICTMVANRIGRHPDKNIRRFLEKLPADDQKILADPGHYQTFRSSLQESFGQQGKGPWFDVLALFKKTPFPLERINIPTNIWHGTADSSWPVSFAGYLQQAIPHASSHILPGRGHLLHLEEWQNIIQEIPV